MKAYLLYGVGDLQYENVNKPMLKPGWVIVKVMAAGICGSDIPRIYETGTYHFPTIPGHEFAGEVIEICESDTDNTAIRTWIGKRVGVFPLIPCMKCSSCRQENYEMCSDYDYLGSRRDGGFAEYVAVPVWNLIELPDEVSYEEAAMLEPMSVARHAVMQISKQTENAVIAIYGVGPIGMFIAQWARQNGYSKVILITNKPEQMRMAEALGFYCNFNSSEGDPVSFILQETNGLGADVTVEGVGTSKIIENCINSTRNKGNILLVGNPRGDAFFPRSVYWQILRRQLRLSGTWNSRFGTVEDNDWLASLKALQTGAIQAQCLITHRLGRADLFDGLEIMRNKSEYYCKVMIAEQDQ